MLREVGLDPPKLVEEFAEQFTGRGNLGGQFAVGFRSVLRAYVNARREGHRR